MDRTDRSTLRAVGVGVGLMVLGIVVGAIGATVTFHFAAAAGIAETDHGQWIARYGLQYGFLALAVAYVLARGTVGRFVRLGRPDVEGIAWIVLAPVALIGIGFAFDPILSAIGIDGTSADPVADPTTSLAEFAVFFVAAWIVAAPAEELLFRGVIQGRLREATSPVSGVAIAAVVFALMHVLLGVLEGRPPAGIAGWGIETFVSGLVFGAAYERTDTLLVPSVIHATMWTLPYVGVA